MSPDDKQREGPSKEVTEEQEPLPPLEGDELFRMETDDLASLIDKSYETEAEPREENSRPEESYVLVGESDDESWLDDDADDSRDDMDVPIDDLDEGWSDGAEEGEDEGALDWFTEERLASDAPLDDGAEGPEGERYEIDESAFAPLDRDSIEEDDEDILDTMDRLGVSVEAMAEANEAPLLLHGPSPLVDVAFLGPESGEVAAVLFIDESPIAVGDGLFVLGADEMFHRSSPLQDVTANSLAVNRGGLFIGTERSGAFVTRDRGKTLTSINSWYVHGLDDIGEVTLDDVSTSFCVSGHGLSTGFTLLGRTNEGQLLLSRDDGFTWQGPISKGPFLSQPKSAGPGTLIAIIDLPGRGPTLCLTRDLAAWTQVNVPESMRGPLKRGELIHCAHGRTMVIGVADPAVPCYRSRDRGLSWSVVDGVTDLCAAAIDADDPGFIAIGSYVKERAASRVQVSDDGGESWQTVHVVHANQYKSEADAVACRRVLDIVVQGGRRRRILVQTGQGVYLVTMTRQDLAH